ncbi:SpoIIE family protein phosphatase [Streptomyces sp. NPDC048185]|uniref:SpoIIE family protein phosphatase n=1 Tax=Streptomyces sp. NPDC048185 TaxID=3365508 RepID=UPI003716F6CE
MSGIRVMREWASGLFHGPRAPKTRPGPPRRGPKVRTVAGQVFLLQVVLVVLLAVAAVVALVLQVQRDSTQAARERTLSVAQTFANAPGTAEALDGPDPTAVLQPRAEAVRKAADVAFVVVSNTQGIRYTHPDPNLIGKHILGPYAKALDGIPVTMELTASVGPAVDSTVPVFRSDGSIAGIVGVEITLSDVDQSAARQLPVILGSAAGALFLALGGAALVNRRLSRQTRGLGPAEMTRMYEHHDAVLHSVREGVLIADGDGKLSLANDEARRLLGLRPEAEGRPVAEAALPPRIADLLESGGPVTDEVVPVADRLLVVNLRTTADNGGPPGVVATVRDTTELRAVIGRAEAVRERLLLLYEAGTRIGTTLDVTTTAQELTRVVIPRFSDFATVDLAEAVFRGDEPGEADGTHARMRRAAVAGLRDDHPLRPLGRATGVVPTSTGSLSGSERHSLPDADVETALARYERDPEHARRLLDYGFHSVLGIPLHARGVVLGTVNFWRSQNPAPFDEDDEAFARELAARAAMSIDNARRYTREHETAVALQRSLLPRQVPEQNALDVAYRYLAAEAGVGGDWFDVIPLPGARVALVVGDVVGHGLHASATMGRLRTAVHNFAALDLPADELLARLDELVSRLDQEGAPDRSEIAGATCLYAIYDPVAGSFSLSRAGHPGPALVLPDGTVRFPDCPVGLPLGVGSGLPFEAVEIRVPEGSRLVLYTDGLVEARGRDIDDGLDMLRLSLARAGHTPEETCARVLAEVPARPPEDDVALLVAGTRLLDPDRVAVWDVDRDPAVVSRVRREVTDRLSAWGLDEEAFVTELILSELLTNAVRYGTDPVRVRLLFDRTLICEVSDGSSTAPHLRYAATTDEGGRGLFLVAQLADRWGTRYTETGKVIWSEQTPSPYPLA